MSGRASQFLHITNRAIALVAVPLVLVAHIAAPARASIIFDPGTCSVSSGGLATSSSGTCSEVQLPTGSDG